MCLKEKIHVLDKLHSGMSCGAVQFNVNELIYILNKVSLSRNTHKIRLYIDGLMKIL